MKYNYKYSLCLNYQIDKYPKYDIFKNNSNKNSRIFHSWDNNYDLNMKNKYNLLKTSKYNLYQFFLFENRFIIV